MTHSKLQRIALIDAGNNARMFEHSEFRSILHQADRLAAASLQRLNNVACNL
ncbi:MAG: hypothetical protein IKD40_07750 [Bacteroidaceae bacterium]|nr:hypothetical protein [Bacteroidaceae bacterium]